MTIPHASWAEFYDRTYELSFGATYYQLTDATVQQITACIKPPARVLDFGAGTGRLSLPLASMGYEVHAVEPSQEMINQLTGKPGGDKVTSTECLMQDFQTNNPYDMAVCVFTVLLYLLDEESLDKSIQAAANALLPGGLFLIDVPTKLVFNGFYIANSEIDRKVSISPHGDDLFHYEETTSLHSQGNTVSYSDQFLIRYWHVDYVKKVLSKHGFALVKNLTEDFYGTGSQYFLLQKLI